MGHVDPVAYEGAVGAADDLAAHEEDEVGEKMVLHESLEWDDELEGEMCSATEAEWAQQDQVVVVQN